MKTKVTEKNMYAVMGHINKFLRKDTRRYVGIRKHEVDVKMETIMGIEYPIPIYEERETYVPFIGNCKEHWLRTEARKKMKNGEKLYRDDEDRYHEVLLEIHDVHELSCIPIKNGYVVEITGDRLTIKENDTVYVCRGIAGEICYLKNKTRSSYVNFYHMPIPEEEKREEIRKSLFESLSASWDSILNMDLYECYSHSLASILDSRQNKLYDILSNRIKKLDITKETDVYTFDFNDQKIKAIFDIVAASKKASHENIKIIIDDNEFLDIFDAIMTMSKEEIEALNIDENEDDFPIF